MAAKLPVAVTLGSPNVIKAVDGTTDTLDPVSAGLAGSFVGTSDTQTLTNKTLTDPALTVTANYATIKADSGEVLCKFLRVSSGTNWLVFRNNLPSGGATTLFIQTDGDAPNRSINLVANGTGVVRTTVGGVPAEVINATATQTMSNKTLTSPTIGSTDFANAQHDHSASNAGGFLPAAAVASGTFAGARLGGVASSDFTDILTNTSKLLTPVNATALGTTTFATANRWYAVPFFAPRRSSFTIDALQIDVTTLSVGGNVTVAIYANGSLNDPTPGSLVAGAYVGGISTTTTGVKTGTFGAVLTEADLEPGGLYWFVVVCDNTTAALRSIPTAGMPAFMGWSTPSATWNTGYYFDTAYSATPPSTFTVTGTQASLMNAAVWLRFTA